MANPEHLEILKQGVEVWNKWRKKRPAIMPDLSNLKLSKINLSKINLSGADLSGVDFNQLNFNGANLERAYIVEAMFSGSDIIQAKFSGAILDDSSLFDVNMSYSDFGFANLRNVYLNGVRFIKTDLECANLTGANILYLDITGSSIAYTNLSDLDLRRVIGLDTVVHNGPSSISIDTIYKSRGKIPEVFLRGCGVPEDFITYMHSLTVRPIQFYSCFISYSHKDEDFARRLFSRMRQANLRVWYAPEEMKGGQKLHEQVYEAIRVYDKLLLVLSENSLQSEWVATEIRRARKSEREKNRRKLFPIRLVDFEAIAKWEHFDADSGKDLGIELREYFIPDFSNWKDHDAFEEAFERLLRDLKAKDKKP
jgi:hypothetical protein